MTALNALKYFNNNRVIFINSFIEGDNKSSQNYKLLDISPIQISFYNSS